MRCIAAPCTPTRSASSSQGGAGRCYTDVDVGTLYYCVRQLAAAGHIEVHGTEKVARGGARTIYRITRGGRARFRQLLMEPFHRGRVGRGNALCCLAIPALGRSAGGCGRYCGRGSSGRRSHYRRHASSGDRIGKYAGTGVRHLLDHLAAQRELDRKWLHRVLKDVERDQVRDSNLPKLHAHLRRSARRPRAASVRWRGPCLEAMPSFISREHRGEHQHYAHAARQD